MSNKKTLKIITLLTYENINGEKKMKTNDNPKQIVFLLSTLRLAIRNRSRNDHARRNNVIAKRLKRD